MVKGVLCSGAIVYDTLVRPVENPEWGTTTLVETLECHVGGNGANTSRALARLGTPVRLLATVGRDAAGAFVVEAVRRAGVDTAFLTTVDGATAATVALVNGRGERKFLHALGANAEAFAAGIEFTPELIAGMAHYHMASLFILPRLRGQAAGVLARARAAGLTTSLDTNWDAEGRWLETIGPCLPQLDHLFMNEDEARMLPGARAKVTVVKLGARGCAVFAGESEIRVPALDVPVVDTTGAGDAFVAGFLDAIVRGEGLETAARRANEIAAECVQRVGA